MEGRRPAARHARPATALPKSGTLDFDAFLQQLNNHNSRLVPSCGRRRTDIRVGCGLWRVNMIWMAWIAAAIAVAGFVAFGMFVVPSKSSAVILPDVRSARQALTLSAMLAVARGHSGQPVLVARETPASC